MDRFKLIPAAHLFLIRDNKVLLLRRYNTGFQDGNYSVPAGHIDGNEPATVALKREISEEIGLNINEKDLKLVHVMHKRSSLENGEVEERVDFFFALEAYEGIPTNEEPDKCDELLWVDVNSLPDNMIPYVKAAFNSVLKNEVYSEFGWES